jgi:hypothetical protein
VTTNDVFPRVTGALDQAGIAYMLTGSFASSYYGVPRTTQDIDFVIAPTTDQLRSLAALLPEREYYFDLNAALEAQRREGLFNIIDLATGWKIDLIIRKSRPFSREEFDRRLIVEFEGMRISVATAEDVLIAKLEWAKRSGSQRQVEDAAGVLRNRSGNLDLKYIEKWVRELKLEEQWGAMRQAEGGAA